MVSSGTLKARFGISYKTISRFVERGMVPAKVSLGGRLRFRESDLPAIRETLIAYGAIDGDGDDTGEPSGAATVPESVPA